MAKKWERSDAIVAQRIHASQIGGIAGKKIFLRDDECAIVEHEGKFVEKLLKGKHKVAGISSKAKRSVVFFDSGAKDIRREMRGLWTADDKEITAAVEMKIKVDDPEKLRKLILSRKDIIMLEDLWSELKKEVFSSVLQPVVKKKTIDQLQEGRKALKDIQVSAEVELKKKFQFLGIELVSFDADFLLPGEYGDYLRRRGILKEETEKKRISGEDDIRKALNEREIGKIKGTLQSREQTYDEMERERVRRETTMAIEEEETQQDMKDALEGLKLKDIKDRQKMLRRHAGKKLGLKEDSRKKG